MPRLSYKYVLDKVASLSENELKRVENLTKEQLVDYAESLKAETLSDSELPRFRLRNVLGPMAVGAVVGGVGGAANSALYNKAIKDKAKQLSVGGSSLSGLISGILTGGISGSMLEYARSSKAKRRRDILAAIQQKLRDRR